MQRKRELAFEDEFTNVSKEIGTLTPRDLLIGGIFLSILLQYRTQIQMLYDFS
jgi:hypothetical protein